MNFHSMKRKELQALCKKHKIPANLKNLEMANRLTSLSKGEDKLLGENGCEIESDVENKHVKKVRFSPEIQTFEFQKSEVKYFTRSRGRRLVEKCAAAKEKEGKGGIKNRALGGNLPSDIDNVASNDVENKDRVKITRKSLRRKEVVNEGRSKNEDMEKGLKKKGRERNLRQGKGITRDKEKSPVVLGLRRSRRYVSSCNEPLVTLDDLVEDVNYERKRKRQRGNLVKEQETVLVDSISIELPLAPLSPKVKSSERAVPASVVGKFAQKDNRESKKQTVEIEEQPNDDIQPSLAEVAEGSIARDSENKGFIGNMKKQKWRSGSNSGMKSPPESEDCLNGVNMKITASNSMELDNVVDQSESTDSKGIQVWVELSIDMETMSRPVSLDHLVEDERISSLKSQQCIENQGFQSVSGDVLERDENANLHGLCDCSSTLNSCRALDQKDLSQIMQTNKAEINDVSGDRNNDQMDQICTMSAKSDDSLKENYDSADKLCESGCLELSRSVTRTLRDENDNGGEKSEQFADLEMKHLGVPSDDKDIETSCSQIEYDTLISSSETIENILELNSTSDNPESNKSYVNQPEKDGDADLIESCMQAAEKVDNNFVELASSEIFMTAEVSTISMNVDIPLEKLQSPIRNMCGSEADNVAEVIARDHLDLENLNVLDQSVEDIHFDKPEDEIDDEDSLGLQKNDAGLKSRKHSPSKDRDWCEADSVTEVDRNYGHGELKSDELSNNIENRSFDEKYHFPRSMLQGSDESTKSVEERPSEEECNSPDKCRMLSPSRRILEDRSTNADKDFNKSGDEMFDENGTKEDSYDEINEKISDFASSKQLSEANFTINNFQEFSCKEQEDNGKENRENLTSTFSQVQFSMPEIHGEDEIVNNADDVSSSILYKHHEILKESDVADTINEYIESESTMNQSSSLSIDDTGDTLNTSLFTQVCRKSELSDERDQEKGAADLQETALRSSKISDSKPTTTTNTQWKNSDEMRTILIHGTPRKIQMAADMKNLPSFKKIEKIGFLTTVKPTTTKRTALKDVFAQQK